MESPEHRVPDVGSVAPATDDGVTRKLGDLAAEAGLRRVHMLAWRDLADVEAGGSEVHASTVARHWSEAGVEVTIRTSYAQGQPPMAVRDGYRVVRRAGRYMIFPRAALSELRGKHGPRDALVEIWNGMPFFSPLWARGPKIVFVHHVHAEMWRMVLPPNLARVGELIELRLAPPLYRRSRVVTLSESSKDDLVRLLGFDEGRITVVPPGIDERFSPGDERSPHPLVVAVGRMMPVKRFDHLIDVLIELRRRHPGLEAVLVGEGYYHYELQEKVRDLGAAEWLHLPGRVSDEALVELYRRAWVLASASASEGWGLTITEAAACGTPAVVTRITGHRDAVDEDRSGLLAGDDRELTEELDRVLSDASLRRRLSEGALAHAERFSWGATALETMRVLADEALRTRGRRLRRSDGPATWR